MCEKMQGLTRYEFTVTDDLSYYPLALVSVLVRVSSVAVTERGPFFLIVAVVGSRDFPDLVAVRRYVAGRKDGAIVVSGGARGVDRTAEEEALECGFGLVSIFPYEFDDMDGGKSYAIDYHCVGKDAKQLAIDRDLWNVKKPWYRTFAQAARIRNGVIVGLADHVEAFQYRASRGTQNAIEHAKKQGVDYHVNNL